MRRTTRLVTFVALAAPGVALAGPAAVAHAAAGMTKVGVLQNAWFWETAAEQANSPVATGPLPATEPSGVPKGDLAVATTATDGTSTKMSVLSFSLGKAATAGSTITTFTFSLQLDNSPGAANFNPVAAPVVACLPTRGWAPADGGDYTDEPPVDCSSKVKPKVKGDTYTFDIPLIAQQWVGAPNLGVALVNDPDNKQPFQVVFQGADKVTAQMAFEPPLAPVPTTTTASGHTGGTTSSSTGSTGSTGGSAPAPAPAPAPVNLPAGGATTSSGPADAAPPVVASSGGATPAAAPAAVVRPAPSTPGAPFWLAGAALALLVAAAYVVLRDPVVPVPTATTTRLSRVLRERELARDSELSSNLTPRRV